MTRIGDQIFITHMAGTEPATIIAVEQHPDGPRYIAEYHDGQRTYITQTQLEDNQ